MKPFASGGQVGPGPSVSEDDYRKMKQDYFKYLQDNGKNVPSMLDGKEAERVHRYLLDNMTYYEPGGRWNVFPLKDAGVQLWNGARGIFNDVMGTHFAAGGQVGPGDPPMSDEDVYQNYASQLKGNPDAPRLASVLTLASKYHVSPASIYTSTTTAHDGSMPKRRTFTIIEKGKPRRTLIQDLAGAAAGSDDNTPYFQEPVASLGAGGSIHIKPENRGKFTATMKRTGKSASELAHSSNPLTRRRAVFALNARKWNH
jgi:hypothetical protein